MPDPGVASLKGSPGSTFQASLNPATPLAGNPPPVSVTLIPMVWSVLYQTPGVGPVHKTVPVTVTWKGHDATSGVNHYTLYQSKDGGAYTQVATTKTGSSTRNLAPGHTYQFEVTATDNAGNVSNAKAGKVYTLKLIQENSSSITYSTGWTRQTLTGASGGSVDFATVAGKTATLSFTGIQAAWVSTVGSTRGSATVKLDSGATVTISTHGTSPKTAQIVDVVSGASGAHKLVVKVLGTSGHPRVDVDAFVVLAG